MDEHPRLGDRFHSMLHGPCEVAAMSIADDFRAKAFQCFERASRTPDPAYQRLHRDLAVHWPAWAAEVDGRGIVDPAILPPAAQRRRA
jgi:hypothetical protein